MPSDPLYIALVSVHGLIRGHDMELGRDADTGGQTKYVVELARALAEDPRVAQVDLLTRQVIDAKVSDDYARPIEEIGPSAYIVRIPCGPRRYLRKEVLWPYLDSFVDGALQHFRRMGRAPDFVHGHYADAGYVAAQLAGCLGIPMVFTGHSLGREKERRLLDKGMSPEAVESQFHMSTRIEAEEIALDNSSFIVASTRQEVEQQYALYDNYQPPRMVVIPPGVDLTRFKPSARRRGAPPVAALIDRFLHEPRKPLILALSRPDARKNIATLVQAFGENGALRDAANLAVVAGSRDDLSAMERGPRDVLTDLLLRIDRYDLYGKVAYPKHHAPDDVPDLYRLAAQRRGVFVNPALTEPFGLTLIEAAATGLPIVATNDGGPREIVARCENGVLIDPLDADAMGEALLDAISDRDRWKRWSTRGIAGAKRHFSWTSHARSYLRTVRRVVKRARGTRLVRQFPNQLVSGDRILICDVDDTLIGDDKAMRALLRRIMPDRRIGFGLATGRRLAGTLEVLEENHIPVPDVLITSVGSQIHYGPNQVEDRAWTRHVEYRWNREDVLAAMDGFDGIELQEDEHQGRFKISFYVDPDQGAPTRTAVVRELRRQGLHVNVIYSHGQYMDLVPVHASKGRAVRYLALKWGLPMDRLVVVGDAGNDEEMLTGNCLAVVVGNYSRELEKLRGRPRIRFAEGSYAEGVLEGLEHYDFFGDHGPIDPGEQPDD